MPSHKRQPALGRTRAQRFATRPWRSQRTPLVLTCAVGLSLALAGCLTPLAAESLLERVVPGAMGVLDITSVTPDRGPTEGGTEVTIRGTNFEPGVGVLFGDQAALSVEYVNEGLMRATVPPQGAGAVTVSLIDIYGREVTTEALFAYLAPEPPAQAAPPPPPTMASITPTSGPTAGGTTVTITGAGFDAGVAILFGGQAATSLDVLNSGLITAITPARDAGVVDVILDNGLSQTVMTGGFAYLDPQAAAPPADLAIESIAPTSSPTDGGTLVTIIGSGFVDGMGVVFGTFAGNNVTVVNETLITTMTPQQPEGDVLVTLTAPDGREAIAAQPFTYYFGIDSDGDGLTDLQEQEGWDIWVDFFGIGLGVDTYGNFPGQFTVTSDPNDPDTDGDGLTDREEFLIISDPRSSDTDQDGLHDAEEVNRWLTSPITVDTDGDSRGPTGDLVPNTNFFDGAELGVDFDNDPTHTPAWDATSPKLADTDGDGRTDWEEFDHPWRSALIADLPALELEVADDIDIRLDIEYAEEEEQTTEYGHSITEGTEQTQSRSNANTWGVSLGFSAMIGSEGASGFPCCTKASFKQEYTFSAEASYSHEWTRTWETAESFQEESSRMEAKSLTHTETAASGSITTGVTLTNTGPVSYHLSNLGMTVRLFERAIDPDDPLFAGSYKTMATLVPALGDGVTLAPGQSTPVLQIEAQDVNADRIKDFMRAPHMLHLEEAYFDLETEDGVNYAFMEEITQARTATILLDFSDGESYKHRIATNVNRLPDGSYAGVRMADALGLLGIEFRTAMRYDDSDPNNPIPTRYVLTQVRKADGDWLPDVADPNDIDQYEFWLTVGNSDDFDDDGLDFADIVLHAGDTVFLVLARDGDGDGLYSWDEDQYGTSDDPNDPTAPAEDYDGDGLTDLEEASTRQVEDDACDDAPCFAPAGWDVHIQGDESYHVFSDPSAADADGDGLNDLEEKLGADGLAPDDPNDTGDATDPNKRDTDRDALPDDTDPLPLVPAARLFVKPNGTNTDGLSWETAYTNLRTAATEAQNRNTNSDPADDVSEIWVAAGTYDSVLLPASVGVYGGFVGEETKRGQRNEDPMTNDTVIRPTGPSSPVLQISDVTGVVVDGFTISDGRTTAIIISPYVAGLPAEATLRNLFIVNNSDDSHGAACSIFGDSEASFESCVFANNHTEESGGALSISDSTVRFSECQFIDNHADERGGAISCEQSALTFDKCGFFANQAKDGGAITSVESSVSIDSCDFDGNLAEHKHTGMTEGGAIRQLEGTLHVANSRFVRNSAENEQLAAGDAAGGGIWVKGPANVAVLNCLFWRNKAWEDGTTMDTELGAAMYLKETDSACLTNCTIVDNVGEDGAVYVDSCDDTTLLNCIVAFNDAQLGPPGTIDQFTLSHCCVHPGGYNGHAVLDDDPNFPAGWEDSGDLHLADGSPCIDYGNNYVDTDLTKPGPQYLPLIDLDGSPRFVDGDGVGEPRVDLGAYEYQGATEPGPAQD